MKNIGQLITRKFSQKEIPEANKWDEKSIFYAFQRIIREEYGNQGVSNLQPRFWKDGKIFIETQGAIWSSELQMKREEIRARMNKELGGEEVREIKVQKK